MATIVLGFGAVTVPWKALGKIRPLVCRLSKYGFAVK